MGSSLRNRTIASPTAKIRRSLAKVSHQRIPEAGQPLFKLVYIGDRPQFSYPAAHRPRRRRSADSPAAQVFLPPLRASLFRRSEDEAVQAEKPLSVCLARAKILFPRGDIGGGNAVRQGGVARALGALDPE